MFWFRATDAHDIFEGKKTFCDTKNKRVDFRNDLNQDKIDTAPNQNKLDT